MKFTLAGSSAPLDVQRRAAVAHVPGEHRFETHGGRRWLFLPHDVSDEVLGAYAREVDHAMIVIEVHMAPGMRGRDVVAQRYELLTPEANAVDLSRLARELVYEWSSEGSGFDEEDAATEIAWELAADEGGEPTNDAIENLEDRWAIALLDRLVETGAIELRGKHRPTTALADRLQHTGADLGERLFDALISSTAVDEVFVEADALAEAAALTRPLHRPPVWARSVDDRVL